MKAVKEKETMTIRPGKEYKGIVEKLEKAAKKDKRSLNSFVLIILSSALE